MTEEMLSAPEVCRVTGASYRQLDYWSRTDVLRAAREARGSGTQRRYTPLQARVARVLLVLARLGAQHAVLREVAATLCDDGPEWEAPAVITARGVVLPARHGTRLDGWYVDLPAAREHVEGRPTLTAVG